MNDQLQKIEQRMAQLKAQKQAILNREKEKERKERTRRLIQVGAVVEKYLQVSTPEQAELLGEFMTADKELFNQFARYLAAKQKPEG